MNVIERAAFQLEFDGHYKLARELREHLHNPQDHIFEAIYRSQKEAWKQLEESLTESYQQALKELESEKQNDVYE